MMLRTANLLLLILSTQFLFAQFPEVKWDYFIGAPAFGSAAAADMDNDGFYEIVFTTYTNDGRAHCLNAEDGSVKWIYDIGGCGDVAPIIYDMNLDGILDVVINGSCNPTIFCINGATGELIWSKPSGGGDSPPTVADMDNDGKPEVLFGNFNGEVRVLNGEDGTFAKVIQVEQNFLPLQTEPTLVDVNNDGRLDILGANFYIEDGLFVWAFDYDSGEIIWTHETDSITGYFHAYHGGAVADIDNDGLDEYVIGSGHGFVLAINVEDGSELWKRSVSASNMGAITIADLDKDGELEIIFNNNDYLTFDERIRILSGPTGEEEWSFPIVFNSFRGMSVSDINGNEKLDLVSGHFMGSVRAVEPYTGLIWEMDLRDYFPPAPYPWFEADHQPLIADFDQNGTMDVFVVAGYGTYEPDSLNTGKAFMIEAGEGSCPEWLMFRHDMRRTGYISNEEIETACAVTDVEEILLADGIKVYPNPSVGSTTIEYELNYAAKVKISLTDVLGRVVQVIKEENQLAGNQALSIFEKSSGVYFCILNIDEQVFAKKIIITQ